MVSTSASNAARGGDRTTQAYERLRRLIVEGRLSPGARLVEGQLASRLGLSRTPIRSALQRLEQEGYVIQKETARQSHPYVSPLTAADGEELLVVLGQLEGVAARNAAALEAGLRTELADTLAQLNDGLRCLPGEPAVAEHRFGERDRAFHQAVVDAGAGPRITALHRATRPQAERYFRLYAMSLAEQLSASIAHHDAIVEAIREGDADGSEAAVVENWRSAARRLRSVIERLGERGSW